MEVFVWLHENLSRLGIVCISVLEKEMKHESKEEDEEQTSVEQHLLAGTLADDFVVHIINIIEGAEDAGEEHHCQSEDDIPNVEQRIEAVASVCPLADDGLKFVGNVFFLNEEIRAIEESGNGSSQEERSQNAIDNEDRLEGFSAKQISQFVLELIAHGLKHEGEKNRHPEPVGTAETGAIEERERGKESTTESDEGGEGEFPFAPCGIDEHATLFSGFSDLEKQRISTLNKHEKHE